MRLLSPIAVIGAGAWGTALAISLARQQQEVRLWGRNPRQLTDLAVTRCNQRYLPGIRLPETVRICSQLAEALFGVTDILIAVPSSAFREQLRALKPYLRAESRLVWATKGLDPETNQLLSEVVAKEIAPDLPMAVLSGPSFAKEVATDLPTAVAVASNNERWSQDLVQRFHYGHFRVYLSRDMVGVQLGGAVKNVLAIACGISDGIGFGANARCALITRGLAEMVRLGVAKGAQQSTFMGLSGLGDLILTSTDDQSRNRRFGLALGRGSSLIEAKKQIDQVVEGQRNAIEVYHLAQQLNVTMPITEQIYRVIRDEITPQAAVTELLARPATFE